MTRLAKQLPPSPEPEQNRQLAPLGGEIAATDQERLAARFTPVSRYMPEKTITDFGLRGYLRTAQILWFFLIFALRLFFEWFAELDPKEIESRPRRALNWIVRKWYAGRRLNLEALRRKRSVWLVRRMAALGPTFIKIGQTLSTRPDIVPLEYTKELSKLQDQVPPFSNSKAWAIIESELGEKPETIFARIDPKPVAAASLGQVYRAQLKTGELVAVKVQRPQLERVINLDLAILRRFVSFLESSYPQLTFGVEWQPIINEFAMIIFEEIDYLQEAENAEIFRKNFADWKEIYVPQIHWRYCSRRVIVEEFIEGLKVDDILGLTARQHEPIEIVKLISRTYLKQLLEDGFFHADPHPGNLRVMVDGKLAFFDFGMVGRLPQEMQTKLVDCFFHIVERDVHGIVEDLIELKFLKEGFDPEEFRPAVEEIFSQYIGLKLGQLKFKELSYAVSEMIYTLPFTFPANITFVMRALTTLEGIGILVDPGFSFFDTVKPYAKEFMLKRESRYLRDKLIGKLVRGENGKISWSKVWKLAKMAFRFYLGPKENKPSSENKGQQVSIQKID
jgi:predicted unusual protein kinase regulating ubiquinone biosynthesis (AarF/ABC1/UbiB family)